MKAKFLQLRRFTRTLRFRVASTFLLLLTISLTLVGFVGTKTLQSILETQSEQQLRDQMGALKGYIRVGNGGYGWDVDHSDPEEVATAGVLQTVFEIADDQGNVREEAPEEAKIFSRAMIQDDLAQIAITQKPVIR